MRQTHVGVIGYGAIAQDLIDLLIASHRGETSRVSVLVRAGRLSETRAALEAAGQGALAIEVTDNLNAFLDLAPQVVAECAGHGAVSEYGPAILSSGADLVVASVGAMARPDLAARLAEAAEAGDAQCVVPSGAIGGVDALAAAKLSGLISVDYVGRKPPMAWRGTPAEDVADLAALTEACAFFTGTAREAAQAYPKNANVAATLALAGLGLDATNVRLIADPATSENTHEFTVASHALNFSMRLVGLPSDRNPKTSRSTAYSVARAVLNRRAAIVI